jgi:hypothetical protein
VDTTERPHQVQERPTGYRIAEIDGRLGFVTRVLPGPRPGLLRLEVAFPANSSRQSVLVEADLWLRNDS